ncbi:SMI1/KNR4 family protein [Streptomyces sp. NPDC088733]|uniref:SMI1/KNR4 family protein n=1 Tax=Streptomyces sp. NPDC088733 TaxID=3365880 RepID=UPI00382B88F0
MSERSLSPHWLSSWASTVSDALNHMTEGFERRHGYPPGTNLVRSADQDDQDAARALAHDAQAPDDLITLYDSIGEIAWSDVGNGYFLHSAGDTREMLAAYGAIPIGNNAEPYGLVIGTDGGGRNYITDRQGVIWRTRTATLDEPELDQVANDLQHFLEQLQESLTRFIATGEPGRL